jgi:hypothetical protein
MTVSFMLFLYFTITADILFPRAGLIQKVFIKKQNPPAGGFQKYQIILLPGSCSFPSLPVQPEWLPQPEPNSESSAAAVRPAVQ